MVQRAFLFGELRLASELNAEHRLVTRTQDSRRLFVILALSPIPLRRSSLGALLWPDTPEEVQRARLRYSLAMLRRAIGDNTVVIAGADAIAFSPEIEVDVRLFWQQIQAAVLASEINLRIEAFQVALRLAQNPLLVGWNEPWVVRERVRLEACKADVVRALVTDLTALGRESEATLWQHLIPANDSQTRAL